MLVRITKHIVIITIPDQTIGAEDVPFAIVAQLLLLADIVGKVLKSNLLPGIDGLVDCIHKPADPADFSVYSLPSTEALRFSSSALCCPASITILETICSLRSLGMNLEDCTASISSFSSAISNWRLIRLYRF